mgnify:CR=1 FL=1
MLKRLDLAFQAFFRRVKAGEEPGYPRFRSLSRFPGWGYKEHGNGFKIEFRAGSRHGFVTLYSVGRMRMRGIARTPGRVLKADVLHKDGAWMLSVVVETDCAARAPAEGAAIGIDWGVTDLVTIASEDGGFEAIANPRHLVRESETLKEASRALSALARARKISKRALRLKRRALARAHAKVAARRKDYLHKISARLARHRLIVTEELSVRNMTRSARGTVEEPGRKVAQKAGLNRSILDTAPPALLTMIGYKAVEAGAEFLYAPTRRLKPSQRCPSCGNICKKTLAERIHDCSCGCRMGRDEAAARVLLNWGMEEVASRPKPDPGNSHPAGTVGVLAAHAA